MELMSVEIKSHTKPSKFTLELEFNSYEAYFIFEAVTGNFKPLVPNLECFSASSGILQAGASLQLSLAESLINRNMDAIIKKLGEVA